MDRRTFNKLAGLAMFGAVAESTEARAQSNGSAIGSTATGEEVVLQDSELLVAFDKGSGAITRLERKSTHWTIARRPELGVSFRLLAPLPHRRANFVLGQNQRATKVVKVSDTEVELEWKDPVSEHGGALPLIFTAAVTLEKGVLTFDPTLVNRSSLTIETVDYPYFGDVNTPTPGESMQSEHMWYGNLNSSPLSPAFRNDKGYWGVDFPTMTIESKQSLFCLIQAAKQGLYVEMHDPTQRYLLEFTFEQRPGFLESPDSLVPQQQEISGRPVNLEFRTCHFVFVQPQSTKKLVPVVLRAYDGDWHAGLDLYKNWRSTWFQQPHIAGWVKDVHSWLQLQIDGAEQDYRIPYRDLPKYIDECAANGVTAIQLVGWARGGQDSCDPSLDTDPGLGTRNELHDAILHARAKGVKMILFGKPIWADLTTEQYKTDLYKYEATDPYGIRYETNGYSYTTPTQLAQINNRRRAIMDVQCPAYRDVATKEFQKILDLGAAGWLFDEVCHHGPVEFSFSPNHGYAPPGYIYGGDMPMARQFHAASDKIDPDFIHAGEGPQDWLLQYYPVSYFRINNGSRAVCRYVDSQAPLLVAVTGFDDREMLNLLLAYRYIISYEPLNFKGHLTAFPLTLSYGQKIDALRTRYKAWLWDAEFRDTLGANVSADGQHRHTVFVTSAGKRAVVVINHERSKTLSAEVQLPNPGKLVFATPEQPDSMPLAGNLTIPPRSVAVVMEL
ncbi:hypothetical protein [Edaphobacter bradus]|uniref:hypothetical protein n=1 Tax=Edaphobacter bradus TaxID=2259016 RepID=UPI0021E0F479|nr:hypothetical protein [Edaphobacter bradus]